MIILHLVWIRAKTNNFSIYVLCFPVDSSELLLKKGDCFDFWYFWNFFMSFLINPSNRFTHLINFLRKDNEVYFPSAKQYKIGKKMEDASAAEILLVWRTGFEVSVINRHN